MNEDPIHIAYADDHVAVRMGIVSLLISLGGIVVDIEADNGQELIEKLDKAPKLPSICILDISMPVLDGFDTLVAIRQKWPQMKVLIMTAFFAEEYIIRMIRYGAGGYLLKKCNPLELKRALVDIHNTGMYHSDMVPNKWSSAIRDDLIKVPVLSETEVRVIKYCCTEMSYEEIGEELRITKRSVEGHRDALFRKLKVNSRVSLALYAVRLGYVRLENID